jgi:hypothetical protein
MKKAILAAASALALVACNGADRDADSDAEAVATADGDSTGASSILEGEEPGFEAVAPGTYEVTRPGGEVDTITIHQGMTYSRIAADGSATGGSIYMQGGQTCFTVEGETQSNCFTDGPVQPDGTMQTTNAEGETSTVRMLEGSEAEARAVTI